MPFRREGALWSPSFLPYGRELVVTGNDTPVRIQVELFGFDADAGRVAT